LNTRDDILGHDNVVGQFQESARRGRLATTYALVGPPGVGKRFFAEWLARAVLCEQTPLAELTACGRCPGCMQAAAGSHPDLHIVARPEGGSALKVDVFIGEKEPRSREGLCHDISLKPFRGERKVALIDDADHLTLEAANCLLKTLEEPPGHCLILLIATSLYRLLPTIRSRAQVVRFGPLSPSVLERLLLEQGIADSPQAAARLALQSQGSLHRAATLADPELQEFRDEFLKRLANAGFASPDWAGQIQKFVEAAGKDFLAKKRRLAVVLELAAEFLQELLRAQIAAAQAPPAEPIMEQALHAWSVESDAVLDCLDRTLDALAQTEANAHHATLIEAWLDDLACRQHPTSATP